MSYPAEFTSAGAFMNCFYEHHKGSIRFHYRCFDRILLNGLIQPFQQPERVIGFFDTYRHLYPVSRGALHGVADRFQQWLRQVVGEAQHSGSGGPEGPPRRVHRTVLQGRQARRGRRRPEGARTGAHHDRHRRPDGKPLASAIC